METQYASTAVLITRDLMLESQLESAASTHDCRLVAVMDVEQAISAVDKFKASRCLVDLGTPGIDLGLLKSALPPSEQTQVIAFGPHVQKARLQAAVDAGFDHVLTRGQFHADPGRWLTD